MILVADVLEAMSDNRSLELFRTIALTRTDSDTLISKTKLTCKQYYSRMSRLMNAGLIKRKQGKYTLTAFGKVIYDIAIVTLENAVSNYWKLKAIDSLEMSKALPAEERKKIIDSLIDNQVIKDILDSDDESDSKPYADAGQQQQNHSLHMKAESLLKKR
jgi:predicted transcriptional regulator